MAHARYIIAAIALLTGCGETQLLPSDSRTKQTLTEDSSEMDSDKGSGNRLSITDDFSTIIEFEQLVDTAILTGDADSPLKASETYEHVNLISLATDTKKLLATYLTLSIKISEDLAKACKAQDLSKAKAALSARAEQLVDTITSIASGRSLFHSPFGDSVASSSPEIVAIFFADVLNRIFNSLRVRRSSGTESV